MKSFVIKSGICALGISIERCACCSVRGTLNMHSIAHGLAGVTRLVPGAAAAAAAAASCSSFFRS